MSHNMILLFRGFLNLQYVGALRHSLQDRLSKGSSGTGRDEISLKLRTSTGTIFNFICCLRVIFLSFSPLLKKLSARNLLSQ